MLERFAPLAREEPPYQPRTEEEKRWFERFQACTHFADLYPIVNEMGTLHSVDGRRYPAVEMVRRLDQMRNGDEPLSGKVTRNYGLYDIAKRLVVEDPVYQKRQSQRERKMAKNKKSK